MFAPSVNAEVGFSERIGPLGDEPGNRGEGSCLIDFTVPS